MIYFMQPTEDGPAKTGPDILPAARVKSGDSPLPGKTAKSQPPKPPDRSPDRIRGFITLVKLATSPTRLAILMILAESTRNVGGICEGVENDSQPAVSHQLSLLRHGRLVETARHGREVHYGLTDRGRSFVRAIRTLAESPHIR